VSTLIRNVERWVDSSFVLLPDSFVWFVGSEAGIDFGISCVNLSDGSRIADIVVERGPETKVH
jgi:hypothetical protein